MSAEDDDKVVDMFEEGVVPDAEPIDTRGWVIVASFSQMNGFNDNDMLNLITYLGGKGVAATYRSSGFGIEGAAVINYLLSVPPESKDEAEELIKTFLSDPK